MSSFADLAVLAKLRLEGQRRPPLPLLRTRGTSRRLFVGPANSAGQGDAWARAAERSDPELSANSMAFTANDTFAFRVDQAVRSGYAAHSRSWQTAQLDALRKFEAVLVESGTAPASRACGGSTLSQIRAVQGAGARVGLLFHGSDIRDPDAHLRSEVHSHFGVDEEKTAQLRAVTGRNRELIAQAGVPVFVSTPDLLDEVNGSLWLPVVVDHEVWSGGPPPLSGVEPPIVAHVPSSSWVKGTELVEPLLRRLDDEGTIVYRQVTGVPHREMPERYRGADIVVDQFRVGNYGVAACEALAAGRVVVSHVSERVRARTRALTGEDLPIVEATPETLASVLAEVIQAPERFQEIAERGPGFVRRHHSGARSGALLAEWVRSGSTGESTV